MFQNFVGNFPIKINLENLGSYHKLKFAGCVVSLKLIPAVTEIVAPGANDAGVQNNIATLIIILCIQQIIQQITAMTFWVIEDFNAEFPDF